MSPTKYKCSYIMLGIGILLLAVGLILGVLWPFIFVTIAKNKFVLTENSTSYNMWIKTPIPLYLDVYLFDYVNHDKINDPSVKPEFKQVGPFVFIEVHERENVTWNDNYTVTYYQKRTWQFQPNMSVPLDTLVTTINPLLVSSAYVSRYSSSVVHFLMNQLIKPIGEKPVKTASAREWIFDGFTDPLLSILNKLNISLPMPRPHDRFGWFYGRNTSVTFDGIFNMNTGGDSVYKLGLLNTWQDSNMSSCFTGRCAQIRGSTGDIMPPMWDKSFSLFVPDFCSSVDLTYISTETHQGLKGYKFIGDERVVDNGTRYEDRSCTCTGDCVARGAINVTSCKYGSPLFLSYPHFYLADDTYVNNVDGLHPNKSLHQTSFVIEPKSGVPLKVSAKFQMNMLLQPYSWLSPLKNVRKTFVPMLWFDQHAQITPELAVLAKQAVNIDLYGIITFYLIAAVGMSLLLVGGACYVIRRKYEEQLMETPLIRED